MLSDIEKLIRKRKKKERHRARRQQRKLEENGGPALGDKAEHEHEHEQTEAEDQQSQSEEQQSEDEVKQDPFDKADTILGLRAQIYDNMFVLCPRLFHYWPDWINALHDSIDKCNRIITTQDDAGRWQAIWYIGGGTVMMQSAMVWSVAGALESLLHETSVLLRNYLVYERVL